MYQARARVCLAAGMETRLVAIGRGTERMTGSVGMFVGDAALVGMYFIV